MSAEKILKTLEDKNYKFVDLRFCDTLGKEQHVSLPLSAVDEDLFDEAGKGLEELIALCGVEPLPARERNADLFRNITPPKFKAATEWPGDVHRKVLNMCRPLMLKYGYTEDA